MTIRCLLLDAGGLLFNNVTEESSFVPRISHRHGVRPAPFRLAVDSCAHSYEIGTRGVHDVLRECITDLGGDTRAWSAAWVDDLYLACVSPYLEVFSAIRRLRRLDHRLSIVLANNEAEHWDYLKNLRFGHFGLVDVLASSWAIGAAKPSDTYFARVVARCGVPPAEIMLLDDDTANVAGARGAGLLAHRVTGPAALIALLSAACESAGPSVGETLTAILES